ncbi:GINS complex Sld5 component [Clavulina sp. PMI_390]|nr:GINS complex Sld5 component [Clavulina sp. PMI_390]
MDDVLDETEPLLQKLSRFWVDERGAPEILEWQGLVVEEVLNRIHAQAEMVQQLQSDPRTSEEEYFRIILIQTEAERVKFLVRSYLRARLHKIEKYAAHILSTPEQRARLSVTELTHAQGYKELLEKHFLASALSGVPESLQSLKDDEADGAIGAPNLKQGVFVRARRNCPPVTLPDGETLEMKQGGIHLVQYGSIHRLLTLGDVELV